MIKGGYANIDFRGKTIGTTGVTINGVFEQCEKSNGKMVIVNDIKLTDLDNDINAGSVVLQKVEDSDTITYCFPLITVDTGLIAYIVMISENDTVKYEKVTITTTE